MQQVLILDDSQAFCLELSKKIENMFQVDVCRDGTQLLRLVQERKPRAVVMDLIMTGGDGVGLLREISALEERPIILALTRFLNDYILDAIRETGVEYVMLKPCDASTVAQRVQELIWFYDSAATAQCPELCPVSDLLLRLGVSAKLRGCKYLQCAINLMLKDSEQMVTKELYPAVGQVFGVDGKRVERCIRNAIHTTWQKCDGRVWGKYFRTDGEGRILRPTNAEFISRMADCIKTGKL